MTSVIRRASFPIQFAGKGFYKTMNSVIRRVREANVFIMKSTYVSLLLFLAYYWYLVAAAAVGLYALSKLKMNYGARKKAREEAEYHKGSKDVSSAKFDPLMKKINALNINNQKRLECLVDIIYEKALGDFNSSKACANMCNKLSKLKVPADNASSPDQCVSFRSVIITRCQAEFIFEKTNEAVLKLEKELNECTGRVKRKGLILMLADHYRKEQKRSIGNVRFIGELYNQNVLSSKIIVYCMNHLVDKLEEEKLECLCELLKTTGVNLEDEVKEELDDVFKKMQDYVDDKSSEISSRVRFMIEEVTELRRSRWVVENVVDSQIKMFALQLGASKLIEWFKTSQS